MLISIRREANNRIIPLEETEEEEIQLVKEINDIKKEIRVPKHKRGWCRCLRIRTGNGYKQVQE